MISATVNGSPRSLPDGLTVAGFVATLPQRQRFVAVARNGDVVPKERWPQVTIQEGDIIEVVRMVGGG
ncbi:MAG TPA: sulfur carrier protein ThiS [Dehalococcoidia bacterium]|nr:sulfur carrier protein ThiS [Dehalococcoidia bacterium]